ncbi:MAG: S8 family peptidase [Parcubacteria group bacterium]|nr:S8 family peptidase [Parcubacteria group bacterium]
MKKLFVSLLTFAFLVFPLLSGADYNGRKIVTFRDSLLNERKKDEIIKRHGWKIKHLDRANASVVFLNSRVDEEDLLKNSDVLRVEDDVIVTIDARGGNANASAPVQTLPWGIDRIDAELVWPGGNLADPVKVAVVDTGIDFKHSDLKDNIKGGINTINPLKSAQDDNGHGTHVAGTIGALNNTIGVVGGAPLVDLYAVKVLGANGSGFLSDIIEGLDWAASNGMQVVNMSLGTTSDIQAFHDAIIRTKNAGVTLVAAAGNSGGAVNFPAAYQEVIAVSAIDSANNIASFSSRGSEVDLAAPGVSVFSTYKGNKYATLSGTSMASPHVSASAALVINTPASALYDVNLNNKWDPDEVQKKLQDSAVDLGTLGYDTLYGWGLVNAFLAVQ